jgi:hypothetical protein
VSDTAPGRRRADGTDAGAPVEASVGPAAAVQPAAGPDLTGVDDALGTARPHLHPPVVEPPSPDVIVAPAASRIPGAARDGYRELPTAPVILAAEGPVEGEHFEWAPPQPRQRPRVGPWALSIAIVALAASCFVGWMLPAGLAGLVAAIVTLRRAGESRAVGIWALALSVVSILYSAGWLMWAIPQLPGF